METVFRRRTGTNGQRLRHPRRTSDAPGVVGLSRGRVSRRLGHQTTPASTGHVASLSPTIDVRASGRRGVRPGESVAGTGTAVPPAVGNDSRPVVGDFGIVGSHGGRSEREAVPAPRTLGRGLVQRRGELRGRRRGGAISPQSVYLPQAPGSAAVAVGVRRTDAREVFAETTADQHAPASVGAAQRPDVRRCGPRDRSAHSEAGRRRPRTDRRGGPRVLCREPTAAEIEAFLRFIDRQRRRFADDTDAAAIDGRSR